ncbi:MAG: hypothetical protein NVS9B9_27880 [Ktedonobacteraceae bacterium]
MPSLLVLLDINFNTSFSKDFLRKIKWKTDATTVYLFYFKHMRKGALVKFINLQSLKSFFVQFIQITRHYILTNYL